MDRLLLLKRCYFSHEFFYGSSFRYGCEWRWGKSIHCWSSSLEILRFGSICSLDIRSLSALEVFTWFSEISINLVFRSQCYFASTFYSTAYLFRIISFCFFFLHFILCHMCVCHMFNKVLTYLLTWSRSINRHLL